MASPIQHYLSVEPCQTLSIYISCENRRQGVHVVLPSPGISGVRPTPDLATGSGDRRGTVPGRPRGLCGRWLMASVTRRGPRLTGPSSTCSGVRQHAMTNAARSTRHMRRRRRASNLGAWLILAFSIPQSDQGGRDGVAPASQRAPRHPSPPGRQSHRWPASPPPACGRVLNHRPAA